MKTLEFTEIAAIAIASLMKKTYLAVHLLTVGSFVLKI